MDNQNNQSTQSASEAAPTVFAAPTYGVPNPPALVVPTNKRSQLLKEAAGSTPLGLLVLVALAFGSLLTEFIIRGGFGMGVLIVTALFYAAFLPFIFRKSTRLSGAAIALAVPHLALASSFAFNASRDGRFWMVLATFALFMLQTSVLAGCASKPVLSVGGAADALYTHFGAPVENLGGTFKAILSSKGDQTKDKKAHAGLRTGGKIVLGLVISLPIVAVLLALFAAADAAFEAELDKIVSWIDLSNIDVVGLFIDLIVGALLCVYYVPLVLTLRSGYARPRSQKEHRRWLDPTIGSTVVFASALVYVLFIIVQFKYFFAVQLSYYFNYDYETKLQLPGDMTWAEYARSGFFELSGIIAATFAAIGLIMFICKRNSKGATPLVVRIALTLLSVCNVALTASAVLRMRLYTIWCGLTAKRLGVLFIIAALALCLIVVVVKLWCERLRIAPCVAVIAIAAVTVFGCMNVDRVCANVNVERHISDGTSIDIQYLGQLSYAAAPAVERLMNESPDKDVRTAARGLLAKYYFVGDGFEYDPEPLRDLAVSGRIGRWTLDHQRALEIYEKYDIIERAVDYYGMYVMYTTEKSDAEENGSTFDYDTFAEYTADHYDYEYQPYDFW